MSQDDCDNEICTSPHFLQLQKNEMIDLQESLECSCNVLLVFGFNSEKYDLNSQLNQILLAAHSC